MLKGRSVTFAVYPLKIQVKQVEKVLMCFFMSMALKQGKKLCMHGVL